MKAVEVEVIGVEPPCPRCKATMENAVNAASKLYEETGIVAKINKLNITSKEVVKKYGMVMPPALVVDGVVKVMGRIPSEKEIQEILKNSAKKVKELVLDSFSIILQNQRTVGVCEYVWDTKEALFEFQLFTENGHRFHVDLVHDFILRRSRSYANRGVSTLRSLSDDLYVPFIKWKGHLRNFLEIRSYPGALPFEKTFFTLIRRYISFLNGLSPSPPVTAEEGIRAVRILEAVKKSIETCKPQSLQ